MHSRFTKLITFTLIVLFVVALAGCGKTSVTKPSDKLKVITSIYPVYEFTRLVGGDKVDVTMLVPPGVEPHDWEPTPKEIMLVKSAKLFLYQGAGMENIDKLLTPATLGTTVAVAVSANIPLLQEDDDEDGAHGQHHADAHIWLDPVFAQQEVLNIAAALAEVDPQNKSYYEQNAANLNIQLAQLDSEYRQTLASVPRREIVTSHAAFGYLAKRYNIKQLSIMGLTPDAEPTPDKMAKIVQFCRDNKVRYIFFETLVNPKLSETIAKETGAKLLVLNPVESLTEAEVKQGKNYFTVMRDNLANLRQALSE